MEKLVTNRTVVVEGRYDAVKLNAITDANIIVIDGFAIYSDKAKQKLLKRLAMQCGLILLLDSDGAGFRMRHYITSLVGEKNVLQLYTPAVKGKEKRKDAPGKEGLLGVEGIETKVLYQLFANAIATDARQMHRETRLTDVEYVAKENIENDATAPAHVNVAGDTDAQTRKVTYTDLFRWGLSGSEGSAARKIAFLQALDLPPRLSKKELVNVLNRLYTYEELDAKQNEMFG